MIDEDARKLLTEASLLETGTHPESPAAFFASWASRIPRKWRRRSEVLLTLLVVVSAVLYVWFYNAVVGLLALLALVFSALLLLAMASVRQSKAAKWFDVISNTIVYKGLPFVASGSVAVFAVLLVIRPKPEARIVTSITAVGVLLVFRSINYLVEGRTFRRRFWRLKVARQSQRVLVALLIFVTILAFLRAVVRAGHPPPSTSPVALAEAVIGAVVATLTAVNRVALRQRRLATQLVLAIDELFLALRCYPDQPDPKELLRAWVGLERCLRTGVDTGAPAFATPVESEAMQAVLSVCVDKVVSQDGCVPSWKLREIAGKAMETWDEKECRDNLMAYLVVVRRHFIQLIDVPA